MRADPRRLATRDAVHDGLRIARHNGERNGGRVVAEEAVRRVLAVASVVGARALFQALQERRDRRRDAAKVLGDQRNDGVLLVADGVVVIR